MNTHTSYAICTVQRSGSNLLCLALGDTGLAGRPGEFFRLTGPDAWEGGRWARHHGVSSRAGFVRMVIENGSTPNGVFGVKILWEHFPVLTRRLRALPGREGLTACEVMRAAFPNLHYVWLSRRDRVRQAVSWAKAVATGSFSSDEPPKVESPAFDYELIDGRLKLVEEAEEGWRDFFEGCGEQPLRLAYEEFAANYEETVRAVLDYLKVPVPAGHAFKEPRLRKQADALNEEWVRRYLLTAREKGGRPT